MLSLNRQVGAESDSVTVGIDQGTLPADFIADRIYISDAYMDAEPSEGGVHFTDGGNTEATFSNLAPGRFWWVQAWRHTASGITPIVTPYGGLFEGTRYFTLALTEHGYAEASWTDPLGGLAFDWVDEYPFYSDRVFVVPDDPVMGRMIRMDCINGGRWCPRRRWRHDAPVSFTDTVRVHWGTYNAWRDMLTVLESDAGYAQVVTVDTSHGMYFVVYANPQASVSCGVDVREDDVWEITIEHDGNGNWHAFGECLYSVVDDGDGTNQGRTFDVSVSGGWEPRSPITVWRSPLRVTDHGQLRVTGTPVFYATGDSVQFKYWHGDFSVKDGADVGDDGSYVVNMGGLTAPNIAGNTISASPPVSAAATLRQGAWWAHSPSFVSSEFRELHYAGVQTGGSMTLTLRDASTDAVLLGPVTPSGGTDTTLALDGLPSFYIDVQATQTQQATLSSSANVGPRLFYVWIDAAAPVPVAYDLASAFYPASQEATGSAGAVTGVVGASTDREAVGTTAAGAVTGVVGAATQRYTVGGSAGSGAWAAGEAAFAGSSVAFDLASAFYESVISAAGAAGSDTGVVGATEEVERAEGYAGSVSGVVGSARIVEAYPRSRPVGSVSSGRPRGSITDRPGVGTVTDGRPRMGRVT